MPEFGDKVTYHKNLPIPETVQQKFLADYTVSETGCWESNRAKTAQGYAQITVSKRRPGYGNAYKRDSHIYLGHRASWTFYNGPIPDGMVIDHKCFNHACINPEHLRLVTRTQNNARKEKFGKQDWPLDECRWGHKLTEQKLYATKSDAPRMRCAGCVKERNDILASIQQPLRRLELVYGLRLTAKQQAMVDEFMPTLCGRPVTHLVHLIEWDRVDPAQPDQCKTCIRVMDSELGGDDRD